MKSARKSKVSLLQGCAAYNQPKCKGFFGIAWMFFLTGYDWLNRNIALCVPQKRILQGLPL